MLLCLIYCSEHSYVCLVIKPRPAAAAAAAKSLQSCPTLCDPKTAAHQAPPSLGFSRQEYWSGLPFPSPGDRPDPGIEPWSAALQADAGRIN